MSWPTLLVNIDTAHDPNDPAAPAPTWVDITAYVAGAPGEGRIDIERGRDYELDTIDPGTMSLGLDNRASRFDPTVLSGLKPMRQMRVRATYNAITYDLFRGFAERWPQSWEDAGLRGRSEVTAVDTLAALAQSELLDAWQAQARGSGATSIYPLTEPAGSTTVLDILGNGPVGTLTPKSGGTVVLGGAPLVDGLGSAVITRSAWIDFPANQSPIQHGQLSIEAWVTVTATGAARDVIFAMTSGLLSSRDVALYYQGGSNRFELHTDSPGGGSSAVSSGSYAPGFYHVVATIDASHNALLYINGVADTASGSVGGSAFDSAPYVSGIAHAWNVNAVGDFAGSIYAVAFYDSVTLTALQVADLYDAGLTRFAGETPDLRIGHLATQGGWIGATSLPTGSSVMGPEDVYGQNALDAIQEAAHADGGVVYADGAGTLTFVPRTAFYNPTSLYTFGELTGSGEIPYNDVDFDFDADKVVNDWQVSRPDGGTTGASDALSQQRYFRRSRAEELNVNSDDQIQAAADHWLAIYKDPALRVESIVVKPSQFSGTLANTAWAACLGLDIGDCVTVKRRPPGGSTITAVCIVQKIHHVAVDGEWETTFGLTPADLNTYMVWDDTAKWKWDTVGVWAW